MTDVRAEKIKQHGEEFNKIFGLELERFLDKKGIFDQRKFRIACQIHPCRNIIEYAYDNYSLVGRRIMTALLRGTI